MILAITIIMSIFLIAVGWRMGTLEYRLWESQFRYDTAMRDLYDTKFQLLNLTMQNDKGAFGYVYVVKSDSGHYKIGKTNNPNDRMSTFSVKLPMEVEYLVLIQSHSYHRLESALHKQYAHKRINGEWFALSPTDLMHLEHYPGNILKSEVIAS
jgi:predicted GIY-YIG superfamily endonuclease